MGLPGKEESPTTGFEPGMAKLLQVSSEETSTAKLSNGTGKFLAQPQESFKLKIITEIIVFPKMGI